MQRLIRDLTDWGRFGASRRLSPLARMAISRPYQRNSKRRIAFIYEPNRISFSQVYPFIFYARELERRFHTQIRFFSYESFSKLDLSQIDEIFLQLWFTRSEAEFRQIFDGAKRENVKISAFFDSYAHNDLRLSNLLNDHIDLYLKKSLLKDRRIYHDMSLANPNLYGFYAPFYEIDCDEPRAPIPDDFDRKLRLSPNFFTDPVLQRLFLDRDIEAVLSVDRRIDVHARLGSKGTSWYSAMRKHALSSVRSISGLNIVSDGTVPLNKFYQELLHSKICFSPFGYGELCWRDVEAFASGAVLLKPSMDHLDTLPNLYEPGVTYLPIKWDFSDLHEKIIYLLDQPRLASSIAREAFLRAQVYLKTDQFVDDSSFLFVRGRE